MWFKIYILKCTLSYRLILTMTSQIWQIKWGLKIQKRKYLENATSLLHEKKFLNLCLRWRNLGSHRFVADVTFQYRWKIARGLSNFQVPRYTIIVLSVLLIFKFLRFSRALGSCLLYLPIENTRGKLKLDGLYFLAM